MRRLAIFGLLVPALAQAPICIAQDAGQSASGYWTLPVARQGTAPPDYHPVAARITADACGVCHPRQYEQWQESLHAKADSMGLLGQLPAFDATTQRRCLQCHTPRAEQLAFWANTGASAVGQLGGVDCAGCHVRKHQRFGPNNREATPHGKVEARSLFQQSAFCAPCHQFSEEGVSVNGKPLENTYQEWLDSRYAKEERSCQSCHMAKGHHQFKGIHDPQMTRQGLKLQVHRTAGSVEARVWNAGAGHALPTYPTSRIRLLLEWSEGEDRRRRQHVIQRRLDWNPIEGWREWSDTRLLPDESAELVQPLTPSSQSTVSVIVEPDADYHDRVYPELLKMIGESLSDINLGLLEAARLESGRTSYRLYRSDCPPWTGSKGFCPITIPEP
jgi:hypothetical protein